MEECELEYLRDIRKDPLIINRFGSCSNRGLCLNSTCNCDDGWTGRSDFFNAENFDCQINEFVIQILWSITLVAMLIAMAVSWKKIKLKIEFHREKHSSIFGGVSDDPSLLAILLYLAFTPLAVTIIAFLKLFRSDQRIGVDLVITLFFGIAKLGLYSAVFLFQPALLNSILKGELVSKTYITLHKRLTLCCIIFSCLLGFLPLVSVFNHEAVLAVYYWYFGGMSFIMIYYALQASMILFKIDKVLAKAALSGGRMEELVRRTSRLQRWAIVQALVQGLFYLSFILIPALWSRHDYFLPLSWLAFPILMKQIAFTTVDREVHRKPSLTSSLRRKITKQKPKKIVVFAKPESRTASRNLKSTSFNDEAVKKLSLKMNSFHESWKLDIEDDDENYV